MSQNIFINTQKDSNFLKSSTQFRPNENKVILKFN